jgi:uncharacterized protein YbbC (DUF1343 family)
MKIILILTLFILSPLTLALDYGIDRLQEPEIRLLLQNKKLAVLTHAASRDSEGQHLIDLLFKNYELKKIFAPEHGLRTMSDDWVEDGVDDQTKLPVISLYKRGSRAPSPSELKGIDAIVIDLQDVGVRYYTYFSTIAEVMQAAAPLGVEIILLDKPNLLGGNIMEGKVLEAELAGSFTAYHTVPTRHGMTLGELAQMVKTEKGWKTKLTIIKVKDWNREVLLFQSTRPWLAPSPALVDIEQVGLYALWGTLENFNLAVGRGKTNEMAFRVLGAPWIHPEEAQILAHELNMLDLDGLRFTPYSWKVSRALHQGKTAYGVKMLWNESQVRSDAVTYQVAQTLIRLFSDRINHNNMSVRAYGSKSMVEAIRNQLPWDEFQQIIDQELRIFKARRKPYLLY